jgi:transposase
VTVRGDIGNVERGARPSSKTRAPVVLDVAEIHAILARIEAVISTEDHARLASVVGTLVEVTRLVRERGATISRLRRMLGQASSERTADVIKPPVPPADGSTPKSTTVEGAANDASSEAAPTGSPLAPANAATTPDRPKPKPKGHGRIPSSAYSAEAVAVPHESLRSGEECPKCAHGSLYEVDSSPATRVFGSAPLVALRWECQCLRCSGCGKVYTARLPEAAQGPKYSESAASMMAVLRYGMGMPLNRIEAMQRFLGAPVPASTQWEVVRDRLPDCLPVYGELAALAANGDVFYTDDTYVKILGLMGKRRHKLVATNALELPERTGLFTTAVVSTSSVGAIALFSSGRQHAGENFSDLLDMRDPALPRPIHMSDGLDRNIPEDADSVLKSNCLAHGRRPFVDEVGNHPEICAHLLEEIGKVFHNDATCREEGWSGEQRLAFHQERSAPIMANLRTWMEELFATKRVEPNSGLGGAINYLLKRWDALTVFLRVRDAPLDNNMSERSLKRAIRHRRASLFYRSSRGANVGDAYMTLIYTTELHGGDPFRYLTILMTHAKQVAEDPADWLPWNYERALERLALPVAA